jgi:hypothetical protein
MYPIAAAMRLPSASLLGVPAAIDALVSSKSCTSRSSSSLNSFTKMRSSRDTMFQSMYR